MLVNEFDDDDDDATTTAHTCLYRFGGVWRVWSLIHSTHLSDERRVGILKGGWNMYVSGIPLTAIIGNYFRISTRLSILQAANLCEHLFFFFLICLFTQNALRVQWCGETSRDQRRSLIKIIINFVCEFTIPFQACKHVKFAGSSCISRSAGHNKLG